MTASQTSNKGFARPRLDGGGGELTRLIEGLAAPAKPAPARHKAPRPGLRGKGSKPARQTNESFEPDYDAVAEDRKCARIKRAKKKDAKDKADAEIAAEEGLKLREWRDRRLEEAMERVAAYVEWMEKVRAKVWIAVYSKNLESSECTEEQARKIADAAVTAFNKAPPADPDMPHVSKEDRRLINDVEKAQAFCARLYDEATRDANGAFHWPGGLVADKYYRAPFSKAGKKSDEHTHYKRVAASMGTARAKNLLAGDTKYGCHKHVSKLYACDKAQIFFSALCKDVFRIELDVDFPSEAHLLSYVADKAREHDLPARPHIGAAFPDDRRPGEVIHPHLYFILPEGSGVWPWSPERQHRMLTAVIAKLTEIFGGDKGGTAHPYSGKNPLSWLTKSCIIEPERMPTLIEWFEALGCEWAPDYMPDDVTIANLHDAAKAVDKESAAWWRVVQGVAFSTAKAFYRSGKIDLGDREAFAKKIRRAISGPLTKELKPSAGKQAADLAEMIEKVCDYAAESFDPAKCDRKRRNHGAAAHLIEPGMTKREREQAGQGYAAGVRANKSVEVVAEVIRLDKLCGRTPTRASVAGRGRCYNTVDKVWDEAYGLALSRIPAPRASISRKGLFRGTPALPAATPLPARVVAPVLAPSIIPDPVLLGSGVPANPDTPTVFDPVDPLGTEPTAAALDDYVGSTLEKLAAVAWRRVQEAAFAMAKEIHNAGRAKLGDRKAFAGQISKAITDPLTGALRPTADQAAKLAALIVRVFAVKTNPPEASAPASTAKTIDPDPADLLGTPGVDQADPDYFIVDALRRIEHAKRRRLRPSEVRAATQARQPGSLLAAFMASGVNRLPPVDQESRSPVDGGVVLRASGSTPSLPS